MAQYHIKINLPNLLKILGEQIYAEPEAAIREMIQNAHDTCILRKKNDRGFFDPRIHIIYDLTQRTLTFIDNGAGMTEEELHEHFSTIGQGVTKIEREQLEGEGAEEALLLIGQFGIGLLSAFSVAKNVNVFTRSYKAGASGFKWICQGNIDYSVEPAGVPDVGTKVILYLEDKSLILLDEKHLRQTIKKYADFLSIPIYVHEKQVNSCTPPWLQEDRQINYNSYLKSRYDLDALAVFPFNVVQPLPLDGLLFVPMLLHGLIRDFGEIDVYVSRMFVKEKDKELLPHWARFMKGIINCPKLAPTLSRDELKRDDHYATVRTMLGELILEYLNYLRQEQSDLLDSIVNAYNSMIKADVLEHEPLFDCVSDFMRINTYSGSLTINEYLKKSNGTLYYFCEQGTSAQHKLLSEERGFPVIDASWGIEKQFVEKYAQRKNVKLERLEGSSSVIFTSPEGIDEKWHDLERQFNMMLGQKTKAVAFEPDSMPAALVKESIQREEKTIRAGMGFNSDHIQRLLQQTRAEKEKRASGHDTILHLNINNPLMQQLCDMNRNNIFRLAVTTIYNNTVLFTRQYVSPQDSETLFNTTNEAIATMIEKTLEVDNLQTINAKLEIELNELKRRSPQINYSGHRTCFFAFDYHVEENFQLMHRLQEYFLERDMGIELLAPVKEMEHLNILKDLDRQLRTVHFGIADISQNNHNVLYEVGLLSGMGKPLILLQREDSQETVPFDIFGDYRIIYQIAKRVGRLKFIWLEEELDKAMNTVFKMLPEFGQSPKWRG